MREKLMSPLPRRTYLIVAFAVLNLALAGCGQKGPLYLPEPAAAASAAP